MTWETYPNKNVDDHIVALKLGEHPWEWTRKQFWALWQIGQDIPLNYAEDGSTLVPIEGVDSSDVEPCINENYWIWPRGTTQMETWEWFDDEYPEGLGQMLEDRRGG